MIFTTNILVFTACLLSKHAHLPHALRFQKKEGSTLLYITQKAVVLYAGRHCTPRSRISWKCDSNPIQVINAPVQTEILIPKLRYYSNEIQICLYKIKWKSLIKQRRINSMCNRSSATGFEGHNLTNGNDHILCIAHSLLLQTRCLFALYFILVQQQTPKNSHILGVT